MRVASAPSAATTAAGRGTEPAEVALLPAAGARGDEAEELRQALIENGEIKIDRARELLRSTRDLTT